MSGPLQRILDVEYTLPPHVSISEEGRDLISRLLVADPARRIKMDQIWQHPWYRRGPSSCWHPLSTDRSPATIALQVLHLIGGVFPGQTIKCCAGEACRTAWRT